MTSLSVSAMMIHVSHVQRGNKMYKKRDLQDHIIKALEYFPVVTITGPRQSGKTTFCRKNFPDYKYVSLEDPDTREFAREDPRGFLKQYPDRTIIDEFQNVPELTSYLQGHIDDVNDTGMYILTGSNQYLMMENVSQSLAGRTQIIRLLPFSYNEIHKDSEISLEQVLHKGGYPRIFEKNIPPADFYSSYFDTYLQKDLRNVLKVMDLNLFQRFVTLCAARTAQIVNLSSFSNELGIDSKTVKRWISILESGYIVKLVSPYYKNFNKRVVKSPKMYFLDVGLASYLLGVKESDQLMNHPLNGELFETFIFSELQKQIMHGNMKANLYFYRDSNGKEIDFVIESGMQTRLVEVKLTSTPSKVNFKNLISLREQFGANSYSYLCYGGDLKQTMYDTELVSFRNSGSILTK